MTPLAPLVEAPAPAANTAHSYLIDTRTHTMAGVAPPPAAPTVSYQPFQTAAAAAALDKFSNCKQQSQTTAVDAIGNAQRCLGLSADARLSQALAAFTGLGVEALRYAASETSKFSDFASALDSVAFDFALRRLQEPPSKANCICLPLAAVGRRESKMSCCAGSQRMQRLHAQLQALPPSLRRKVIAGSLSRDIQCELESFLLRRCRRTAAGRSGPTEEKTTSAAARCRSGFVSSRSLCALAAKGRKAGYRPIMHMGFGFLVQAAFTSELEVAVQALGMLIMIRSCCRAAEAAVQGPSRRPVQRFAETLRAVVQGVSKCADAAAPVKFYFKTRYRSEDKKQEWTTPTRGNLGDALEDWSQVVAARSSQQQQQQPQSIQMRLQTGLPGRKRKLNEHVDVPAVKSRRQDEGKARPRVNRSLDAFPKRCRATCYGSVRQALAGPPAKACSLEERSLRGVSVVSVARATCVL
eukprot:TRINITY_DN3115_c1_g3_i1.p1 TRINITY_DN3115_c1_g3~~TRINITY_DN3115_c1_g3_i1.p1  ORF type:complete len:468 (+),score=105.10 TRINITY_DN3115_c1_g3_i1:42-1445(+)